MNCASCGKELIEAKSIAERTLPNRSDPDVDMIMQLFQRAQTTLNVKCVCPNCSFVFFLECGEREGTARKTNDISCPQCETHIMSKEDAERI